MAFELDCWTERAEFVFCLKELTLAKHGNYQSLVEVLRGSEQNNASGCINWKYTFVAIYIV